MTIRNRELSQFGSFIYVDNSNKSIGITTEETPYVGIGTTNAKSKFHVVGNAYFSGSVGLGTTNPTSKLEIATERGTVKAGVITAQTTTDNGIVFAGIGTISAGIGSTTATSGVFSEANGLILSNAINVSQVINPRDTTRVGGIIRVDTRKTNEIAIPDLAGDYECFVVKYTPVGIATSTPEGEKNGIIISLQDGQTYLVPDGGNVLVGLRTDTGTANQKLQVQGGAYISGNIGVGTTNPTQKLDVLGTGQFTAGGATLNLVGTDHSYIQWYPDGISAGRKAYTGYPNGSANYFTIANEISDGTGHINLDPGTNAAVLIDTFTATGTANQKLQVDGGAYFNGSVGIGTTNPQSPFGSTGIHISGSSLNVQSIAPNIFLQETDNSNNYYNLVVDGGVFGLRYNNVFPAPLQVNSSSVLIGSGTSTGTADQKLQVQGGAYVSGNIGVGTTNPTQKLQLIGNILLDTSLAERDIFFNNGSTNIYLFGQTVAGGGNVGMYDGTNSRTVWQYGPNFNYLSLGPGGSTVLVNTLSPTGTASQALQVNSGAYVSGSVGIGTTNPTSTLHVVGNGRFSGIVTANQFSGDGSLLTGVKGALDYFSGNVITSPTTTLTSTDVNRIILVDTSSTKTINLPAGVGVATGSLLRIVDVGTGANSSGNAATYNIYIVPNASDQINGAGAGVTFAIDVNGGRVELIWAGATYDWRIVG